MLQSESKCIDAQQQNRMRKTGGSVAILIPEITGRVVSANTEIAWVKIERKPKNMVE